MTDTPPDPPENKADPEPPAPDPAPTADPDAASGATAGADAPPKADPPAKGDAGEKAGAWPKDWQTKMAGDDEKRLGLLKRLASPQAMAESYQQLSDKLSQRPGWPTPPEGATEKQLAAWREENDIPEKGEGYLENLPDGLVIGEDDKEAIGAFTTKMHGVNANPATVHAALGAYYEIKEAQETARLDQDEKLRKETEDALREEHGNENYRPNIARINGLLDTMPKGAKEALLNARDASTEDPIMSNPAVVRGLLQIAMDINPVVPVLEGSGGDSLQSIDDEIAKYKGMMGDKKSVYWKGDGARDGEWHQQRYRDLTTAKAKMAARNKQAA